MDTRFKPPVLWGLAAVIALPALLYLYFSPDDYYIYLQYARNFHELKEFAFNPGTPSYGFTSPLWLLALGFSFISSHPHLMPKLLCFAFYFLSAFIFLRTMDSLFDSKAALFGTVLLFLNPWVLRWSLSGMETTAVLLGSVAFLACIAKKEKTAWLPLGILPLLRPELFVWTLMGAAYFLLRKRRAASLLVFAPTLLWMTGAWMLFGQILPNTAYAKAGGLSLQRLGYAIYKIAATLQPLDMLALAGLTAVLVLKKRKIPLWVLAAGIMTLALLGLYVIKGVKVHTRYLVPLFPLTTAIFVWLFKSRPKWLAGLGSAGIVIALLQTVLWVYPATRNYAASEIRVNRAIGDFLRHSTPADAQVFLFDIGAIAYYSRRKIIDLNGLLDRRIFHRTTDFTLLIKEKVRREPGSYYLVDVFREKQRPALKKLRPLKKRFLFARPFNNMFIFQKKPLYYSVYQLSAEPEQL